MELATRNTVNGKGVPVRSRLLYYDDDKCYYVEVHAPGYHQLVKVHDENSLQRWLKIFKSPRLHSPWQPDAIIFVLALIVSGLVWWWLLQ